MAESIAEQMEYGDHCKHGTNIGTPGGADLMCHWCEMGMDTWVNNPRFELMFEVKWNDHVLLQATKTNISWRKRDDQFFAMSSVMQLVAEHDLIAQESDAEVVMTYWVEQRESGYWV